VEQIGMSCSPNLPAESKVHLISAGRHCALPLSLNPLQCAVTESSLLQAASGQLLIQQART